MGPLAATPPGWDLSGDATKMMQVSGSWPDEDCAVMTVIHGGQCTSQAWGHTLGTYPVRISSDPT